MKTQPEMPPQTPFVPRAGRLPSRKNIYPGFNGFEYTKYRGDAQ
jgi:hypothetical protein